MSQEANGQWACLFPFPCAEVWELAHRLDRLAAGVQATDTGVKGSDQIHKVAGLHLLRLIFAKQLKQHLAHGQCLMNFSYFYYHHHCPYLLSTYFSTRPKEHLRDNKTKA